jgi:hypothetical protein
LQSTTTQKIRRKNRERTKKKDIRISIHLHHLNRTSWRKERRGKRKSGEHRTQNIDTEEREKRGEERKGMGHTVSQISNLISLFNPSSVSVLSVWVRNAAPG